MAIPYVLKGTVRGDTITLDEKTILPDGQRVTLHVLLEPGEGSRLAAGGFADLTPEEDADLERVLTEFHGRPFCVPTAEEPGEAEWA